MRNNLRSCIFCFIVLIFTQLKAAELPSSSRLLSIPEEIWDSIIFPSLFLRDINALIICDKKHKEYFKKILEDHIKQHTDKLTNASKFIPSIHNPKIDSILKNSPYLINLILGPEKIPCNFLERYIDYYKIGEILHSWTDGNYSFLTDSTAITSISTLPKLLDLEYHSGLDPAEWKKEQDIPNFDYETIPAALYILQANFSSNLSLKQPLDVDSRVYIFSPNEELFFVKSQLKSKKQLSLKEIIGENLVTLEKWSLLLSVLDSKRKLLTVHSEFCSQTLTLFFNFLYYTLSTNKLSNLSAENQTFNQEPLSFTTTNIQTAEELFLPEKFANLTTLDCASIFLGIHLAPKLLSLPQLTTIHSNIKNVMKLIFNPYGLLFSKSLQNLNIFSHFPISTKQTIAIQTYIDNTCSEISPSYGSPDLSLPSSPELMHFDINT